MNHWGAGRFRAYSAGSQPTGRINPMAIQLLAGVGMTDYQDRSKSWDEFAADTPSMDLIFTVCDSAAAISLFGFTSGAALATVVGVLIEVPVMLSVVRIVNASKTWYERGLAGRPAP